ncbi:MAG: hypothetical protein HY881_21495 [Deltaproteobacteria bacterium]|nr:hypothetical protein [Deltaproteobacteria bacterium]
MKVGIVFHKNPLAPQSSIDLIRLQAISSGLIRKGIETEVLAPVQHESVMEGAIPVRPLHHIVKGHYDVIKTCYHFSIELIQNYEGPVVSRIVRVVDSRLPERDEKWRERLMRCQQRISQRSSVLVLNNPENQRRWQRFHGRSLPVVLVPTGCPMQIPQPRKNPYDEKERAILFLGSLAAPRMISMLNTLAARMDEARIHVIGLNKVHWYGAKEVGNLHPAIVRHGEILEEDIWDYIYHADMGLALATGPHAFDNDLSKICNYLRGGLPILSEAPVINNDLIHQTGLGKIFRFGDIEDLIANATSLLENPPAPERRNAAMAFMAAEHSWERRVEVYEHLFNNLCGSVLRQTACKD